jgi:hypothetical protein
MRKESRIYLGDVMKQHGHDRFEACNKELRHFLRLAEVLANVNGTAGDADLKTVRMRLLNQSVEVGEASRSVTLDASLRIELAEYVKNLRALQKAMEKQRGTDVLPR